MKKGDRFALVIANHAEFVDFMVASSILGTLFVPIDPRTRGDKLDYMLHFAECTGAVVASYSDANVRQVFADAKWILPIEGDTNSVTSICAGSLPDQELSIEINSSDEPMQMLYTSGTTGDPKAIVSPYNRFAAVPAVGQLLDLKKSDRPYTAIADPR